MAETDLARIELLVLDVDGVLTDGRITLTPTGEEIKTFHVRDGAGLKYWKRAGRKVAFISGRASQAVAHRAKELNVDTVRLSAKDKLPAYEDVLAELGVASEHAAVVADDLTDLPMMRRCGFPVAVADAAEEVRRAAAYVTRLAGGAGCVREVVELLLKAAGLWDGVLARYLGGAEDRRR